MNASKILLLSLISLFNIVCCESNTILSSDSELEEQQLSVDEIIDQIEEELAHFIIFAFCDITGNLKEIIIPVAQAKNALENGLSIANNQLLIKPDLRSLRFLPWTTDIHRTAWFLCTTYKNSTQLDESDPRSILMTLTKTAKDLGYKFDAGIELDFFLLEKDEKGYLVPADQIKYLDPEHNLSKQQEINLLMHALRDFKVDIEKIDHGISGGQWRITLKNQDALQMADNTIACKYALKVLTKELRQHTSFMPKPFHDRNGNKMQVKYSLLDIRTNKNVFYNKLDPFNLSETAKYFLAGNLERAIELSLLFMPTVNSYKNTGHPLQAYNCWSAKNHNTVFNSIITDQDELEEKLYLKFKIPDSSSNIYLTLSALLKSGIDGIKKMQQLDGPIHESIDNISPAQAHSLNLQLWPISLDKALTIFEKSNFAKRLLSDRVHAQYTALKRSEYAEYNSFITDWELKKYL